MWLKLKAMWDAGYHWLRVSSTDNYISPLEAQLKNLEDHHDKIAKMRSNQMGAYRTGIAMAWAPSKLVPGAKTTNPLAAFAGANTGASSGKLAGDIGDHAKTKSDSINSGGQRSIVINIAKQIEKLEVHVMDAKEGVNEIEGMVREAMRRVVYSMNGVAS